MPTPTTLYEPEYDVYEAYGTADESPDVATSPNDDAWPVTGTSWLDREQIPYGHETPPPSWEYTAMTNPRYDNEDSVHGLLHSVYHAVEPHVDDTMLLGHEHHSLWHEMQMADEGWATEQWGELEGEQEMLTGVYVHPNYSPPLTPTSTPSPPTRQPPHYQPQTPTPSNQPPLPPAPPN